MKNTQTCNSCGSENPFYVSTCKKCNFYLRDKIVNIDLWNEIGNLIESPVSAFNRIIQSEHKNFVVSILLIVSVKFGIDISFLLMLQGKSDTANFGVFLNSVIIIGFLTGLLFIYSFALKLITQKTDAKTRLFDNLAILTYALIPNALALCTVFPIEISVFGGNVFSANPSPFILKPTLAHILSGFEILILFWSIFLVICGMFSQTRNKIFAVVSGLIFYGFIIAGLYALSILN